MRDRLQKLSTVLSVAIAISMAAVFFLDAYTPRGFAVWILYVVPILLTTFGWQPATPVLAASLTTVLLIVGYFISPPGATPLLAQLNRVFGVLTVWATALIVRTSVRHKIKVRHEEWLRSGQAELSGCMAGEQTVTELGENVLRYVAEYIGAQAGAMFVEQGPFRRVALHAIQPASSVLEAFALGEGAAGQAARDGRPVILREVPEGYLSIGSGLGRAAPRSVVIMPVLVDGKVNAVLEFGFFATFEERALDFLERASESIAVAVRSAIYRERLQRLLDETQRQAAELQAQSEELRVSNEEIEEQSRALKESHSRLEQQQTDLEETNAQLEQQAQALEAQKETLSHTKALLEAQAVELQRASRYKSEFLANMSHELRTPLNSSLILARLLGENRTGNLTADQVNYARTIEGAGNDLLALINDVLDLSKVEAGRLDVNVTAVPVERLLQGLRTTFEPLAQARNLRLEVKALPGAPEMLETDPQRLEQVLRNLLSNAIKFTVKGEVSLSVAPAAAGRIALAVRDTGMGIAPEDQELIFEPFRQATHALPGAPQRGTGLGLSICRQLVQLLGGELQLESKPGQGSVFTVLLPEQHRASGAGPAVAPAPAIQTPEPAISVAPASPLADVKAAGSVPDDRGQISAPGKVILIVEDDEAFARILLDLAHELRFQALVARTAEEALLLARQYLPSAVVLDIGLPDTNGLSVLDRLKDDLRTRHIPVHVVSGSDYTQVAYAMGAVGYMLKPVKREELAEAFRRLEERLARTLRRVLVVEDDPVQLESLCALLRSPEVEPTPARNARECLEQLEATTFDCLVVDLSLPDASGFSLLETLSREEAYSFPPVIVYTGRQLTQAEEEQLRRYARSVIIKGAKSPERLLDEVSLFLHQVVSQLPATQQTLVRKARNRDAALDGRRVLIVEDDVRNVFALTSILESRGVRLSVARNGREALAALDSAARAPGAAFDLVLMDVMMPEMDGLTATREIRKRAEWRKLPIIVLTAKATKNDQMECLDAGANDYLTKPLDVDKLLSLVRVWMPR